MALLVQEWGYAVRVANDGPTALRLAAEHPPDVVFLDVAMPHMSGWEVARRLREIAGLQGALLVAVTGLGQVADHIRSSEAGCDLHLIKPADPAELRRILVERAKETPNHVSGKSDQSSYRTSSGS
jgi:DNA-binding response OmpR family regulator